MNLICQVVTYQAGRTVYINKLRVVCFRDADVCFRGAAPLLTLHSCSSDIPVHNTHRLDVQEQQSERKSLLQHKCAISNITICITYAQAERARAAERA